MNVVGENWTVSLDEDVRGRRGKWAVYFNGRRVLGGWDTSENAGWSMTFLRRGEHPPYRPGRESIAWPAHLEGRPS